MEQIDRKKIEIAKTRKGFIAALDQSGGSSSKTLEMEMTIENGF